ncbi:hypothetical protein V1477_002805 [Vespula maculifrons]|uniref:Uncharacterized protein n=1 Tax=Vespula maculifrons TaxID=7453 RepID=A0ABD2CVS1_VESMC
MTLIGCLDNKDFIVVQYSAKTKRNSVLAITSNLNVTSKQLTITRDTVEPSSFPNAPNANS